MHIWVLTITWAGFLGGVRGAFTTSEKARAAALHATGLLEIEWEPLYNYYRDIGAKETTRVLKGYRTADGTQAKIDLVTLDELT